MRFGRPCHRQIEKELGIPPAASAPDGHSYAQRRRSARVKLQSKDRRVGSAREAEADRRLVSGMAQASRSSTSTAKSSIPRQAGGGRGPTTTGLRTRRSRCSSLKASTDRRSPSTTTTPCTPCSPDSWIRSAATFPARPRGMSKTRSTIASSRCGRPAPRAIRIPSTTSRRTTCARFGSRTTPSAASTSATRCLRAAKVSTEAIRQSRG